MRESNSLFRQGPHAVVPAVDTGYRPLTQKAPIRRVGLTDLNEVTLHLSNSRVSLNYNGVIHFFLGVSRLVLEDGFVQPFELIRRPRNTARLTSERRCLVRLPVDDQNECRLLDRFPILLPPHLPLTA